MYGSGTFDFQNHSYRLLLKSHVTFTDPRKKSNFEIQVENQSKQKETNYLGMFTSITQTGML